MPRSLSLGLGLLWCALPLWGQETPKFRSYAPPSHSFSCEIPNAGWAAFEAEDSLGPAVHILGPQNPSWNFRSGLSVRWFDRDTPGYMEPKKLVERMRRPDQAARRGATAVRPMRVAGLLARVFEVTETWLIPLERLPAGEEALHRDIAVIPSGSGYYVVTLSAPQDAYLDLREGFFHLLKTFQPLGH